MPDVRVTQPHSLPPDAVRERLAGFADMLGKYGVKLTWSGHDAALGGVPGVGGHVKVGAKQVEVLVSLSRMVTMMGIDPGKLEGSIKRRLEEALRS